MGRHAAVKRPVSAVYFEPFTYQKNTKQRVSSIASIHADREELLRILRQKQSREAGVPARIVTVPRTGPLPMSEVQQRLWTQQALGEGAAWVVSGLLALDGPLSEAALREALDALVARHEPLRTRFVRGEDGQPKQTIDSPSEASLEVRDTDSSEAKRLAEAHAQLPFDLRRGPLFRVLLLRVNAGEHVLSMALHHIIADGWSLDVLAHDMQELYRAAVEGGPARLVPLRVQYADWASWQGTQDLSRSVKFWKGLLANPPAPLALGRATAPEARGEAREVERTFPKALAEALSHLAQGHRASLFMVLLAGWALAFYRRTRNKDLLLGTTVACRHRVELEPLIGFFINIVVFRLSVDADWTGHELLERVRGTVLDSFEHQTVPFERLLGDVEGLRQEGGRSAVPIMVRHQNFREPDVRCWAGGVEARVLPSGSGRRAATDLDLQYWGDGADLSVVAEYDAERLNAEQVSSLLDEVELVLARLTACPHERMSSLVEATAEERRARESFLRGPKHVWSGTSLLGLFAEQARRQPVAVACRDGEHAWTYEELSRRSDGVAHTLRQHSVAPGDRVVLLLSRGTGLLAALLGVWKAGAVYVPVDPSYPAAWAARVLEEVEPQVIVTGDDVEDLPQSAGSKQLILSSAFWQSEGDASATKLEAWAEANPNDLAYISYTSGSTGEPKGVEIEHAQLLNCLYSLWAMLPFAPGEVMAQKTGTGFVVHLKELLAGLLAGVEQWVAPDWVVRDTPALARGIAEHRVTRLNLVPSQLHALLHHKNLLGSLRWVVTAGEPLGEPLRARFAALLPDAHLFNNYGCTELNDITYFHASGPGATPYTGPMVPIGRPIANTRLHLLDNEFQPVPFGVPGRIWVEGVSVGMRGYHRRPELTGERWVVNPFDGGKTRLFDTGDLAQLQPGTNGSFELEYQGRSDFQTKLRGQKVDPLGVEGVLAQHPYLERVAVRGWDSGTPEALLAAYYVPRSEAERAALAAEPFQELGLDRNRLHRWMGKRLPAHMVPAAWIAMDALPVLPNGKLDRSSLPRPRVEPAAKHDETRTAREELLAGLWADLLQLAPEQIGREDNFFAIGGNSLLGVQLVERMRAGGWVADVRLLFDRSTLRELAEAVEGGDDGVVPPNRIPEGCEQIRPEMLGLVRLDEAAISSIAGRVEGGAPNIQDIYPLAPLQEGLLFHYLAQKDGDSYLLSSMLAVPSREDVLALLDALQAVVDRHDILRTSVLWEDLPEPVQVVSGAVRMPVEELSIPQGVVGAVEYLSERFHPSQFRIDLRKAPLLRGYFAEDPPNGRWVVLLLFHHLITDRYSLELLQAEIEAHLRGEADRLPHPLPYRHFVARVQQGGRKGAEQEAFFGEMLGDFHEPNAPWGMTKASVGRRGRASLTVRKALATTLRECSRSLGVTTATLFYLAWAYVVAETSGRSDVVFGAVLSGRLQAGTSGHAMLGLFVNTLPIRIRTGEASVLDEIRRVNKTLAWLLAHEQAPLALAQRSSGVPVPRPLFVSTLNYRRYAQRENGERQMPFSIQSLAAYDGGAYPISLAIDDAGEGFMLHATVDANDANFEAGHVCDYMHRSLEQLTGILKEEVLETE